jgi:hypothetical protein
MRWEDFKLAASEWGSDLQMRLQGLVYNPMFVSLPAPDAEGALFTPGRLDITRGALAVVRRNPGLLPHLMQRHLTGDWGEAEPEDQARNDLNVERAYGMIFSQYTVPDGQVLCFSTVTCGPESNTIIYVPGE